METTVLLLREKIGAKFHPRDLFILNY